MIFTTVGILSNNIERQWAMSSLIDKHGMIFKNYFQIDISSFFVIIGYEIKGDFKWDQAEFQQCVACEEIHGLMRIFSQKLKKFIVMKKHKEAYVSSFNIPIYIAANQMMKCWHDNAGSLKRRIVVFPCRYHVPPNKVDPNLMEKMVLLLIIFYLIFEKRCNNFPYGFKR